MRPYQVSLWKPFRPDDTTTVWFNQKMKQCAFLGCVVRSEDGDELTEHHVKQHTLDGKILTDEEKRVSIMEALSNEEVWCPFCFDKQKHRATRFFLDDGKLSKMARCFTCKAKMQPASMKILYEGGKAFGMFVGGYSHFWQKIDHDVWIQKLKTAFPSDWVSKFWEGYGDMKPEFKEKQRIAQAQREYDASRK